MFIVCGTIQLFYLYNVTHRDVMARKPAFCSLFTGDLPEFGRKHIQMYY